MTDTNTRCSRCGAEMTQSGAEHNKVHYHCNFCGNNTFLELSANDNAEYWQKRKQLLERVYMGVLEWKITSWNTLAKDIVLFMSHYEDARVDVCIKMAAVVCLTNGFHDMNNEKYKECKLIFKTTEKIYKKQCKALESTLKEFPNPEDVAKYEEYRVLYKKCRNEYLNTKLLWKTLFFFGKKVFFWWS